MSDELAADGVGSWSLNGNHDMYSGGWAYFDHLLGEPRFSRQRSPDGTTTSWFRLSSPAWEIIGLDTAWDPDPLAMGHRAVLEDPQAAYVAQVAAGLTGRKLLLLSHHQLVSVYSRGDLGKMLPRKLATVPAAEQVTAWYWGHEHRCMAFEARCSAGWAPATRSTSTSSTPRRLVRRAAGGTPRVYLGEDLFP